MDMMYTKTEDERLPSRALLSGIISVERLPSRALLSGIISVERLPSRVLLSGIISVAHDSIGFYKLLPETFNPLTRRHI